MSYFEAKEYYEELTEARELLERCGEVIDRLLEYSFSDRPGPDDPEDDARHLLQDIEDFT